MGEKLAQCHNRQSFCKNIEIFFFIFSLQGNLYYINIIKFILRNKNDEKFKNLFSPLIFGFQSYDFNKNDCVLCYCKTP